MSVYLFRQSAKIHMTYWLCQYSSVVAIIVVWSALIDSDNYLIPRPQKVVTALIELGVSSQAFNHLFSSVSRVFTGLLYGSLLGILLGILQGLLRNPFTYLIELTRSIPPITWIPISLAIFGTSESSAHFIVFLGAFFPVYSNTAFALTQIPTTATNLASIHRFSRFNLLRFIFIPSILPHVLSGIRTSLGMSWMCVVAAEMISSTTGLGFLIDYNRQILRMDNVIALMLVIGLTGVMMARIFTGVQDRILRGISSGPDYSTTSITQSKEEALSQSSILVEEVSYAYDLDQKLLSKVSLNITPGSVVAIIGKSGTGKSTLLKLIAGLARPTEGAIKIDRSRLAMVFQDGSFLPWFSAAANIRISSGQQNLEGLGSLLGEILLPKELLPSLPSELSGGERQRLSLAIALARRPSVLLLDEPFAAMDAITKRKVRQIVLSSIKKLNTTTVLVTHDIEEAALVADQIIILDKSETLGLQIKTIPGLAEHPANRNLNNPNYRSLVNYLLSEIEGNHEPIPKAA